MAKTLAEINQEFFIEWYLSGRDAPRDAPQVSIPQAPQAPRMIEFWEPPIPPPSLPPQTPSLTDEVDQWVRELLEDPDLDDMNALIDAAFPDSPPSAAGTSISLGFAPAPEPQPYYREAPYLDRQPTGEFPKAGEAIRSKSGNGLWKSISNIFFYAALIAIVLGAVVLGSKSNGGTSIFGFRYAEVETPSMQSVIPRGSLVVTREIPSKEIKAGDIISFLRSDEKSVTHQVIQVLPDFDGSGTLGFQTKGTDNPDPDPDIVAAANVQGVVIWHMNGLGFTLRYVRENIMYVFLIFVLIILLSIAVRVFVGEKRKEPQVQQPKSHAGCNHITTHFRKDHATCKRHTPTALAA